MDLSLARWHGKVAIVTGASSGIGAVISETLVKLGVKVVGVARRKQLLDDLAVNLNKGTKNFYPYKADIAKEDDILQMFAWIKTNLGPVSILINNAAYLSKDTLVDGNTEQWAKTMDINVLGLCIATREAIQDMRANNVAGHIIHINAIGGHIIPKNFPLGIACASKFAVTALTETLRQELNSINSKIKITSVSPSLVDTPILQTVESKSEAKLLSQVPKLQAQDVADAIVYVLSTPPHVQVHELMLRPVGCVY